MPYASAASASVGAIVARMVQKAKEHYYYHAVLARDAGFDGIEIVISPDSFIGQFLRSNTYCPAKAKGRSHFQERFRLLADIIRSVGSAWDLNQVGVRLAPAVEARRPAERTNAGPTQAESAVLIQYVVHCLNDYGLAYLHLRESLSPTAVFSEGLAVSLRSYYDGLFISQGDYSGDAATQAIEQGHTDLVAFPSTTSGNEPTEGAEAVVADAFIPQTKAFYQTMKPA